MKVQITTKTRDQIAADFEATFKDIQPIEPITPEARFEPYREAILEQRARGLSWTQIAAGMGEPRIDEKVSGKTLSRLFGKNGKAHAPSRKAHAKKPKTPKPPKQPKAHLVKDAHTGKPVIVPAGAPVESAPTPAAPPVRVKLKTDTLFDRLAPAIIRGGHTDDTATVMLIDGFVRENRGAPDEAANAFVESSFAKFDALDFATAQRDYGIGQDQWNNWRKEWCELRDLPQEEVES